MNFWHIRVRPKFSRTHPAHPSCLTAQPAGSTINTDHGSIARFRFVVEIANSINGVPIRLTDERWLHIVENKPYMYAYDDAILKAIEAPTVVLRGYAGSLIAVLALARDRFLHVVYKEVRHDDGFVITAYVAQKYNRDAILWPRRS
jgi:hypothetical protein